ncbi:methionyl-tRNA formyltransferase [Microcella putealis]|uniref:Methionyl-tRNA formyltransferase n=1 Tax=Microcella putealis TaxID=337005 RepID=A0A4V2EXA5_9MICO|nr:methionyl-tRNA formyltransferase [Microcella putealis]TQM25029.1 methionyl-tRNA formyltransferase [Microcella putealis]
MTSRGVPAAVGQNRRVTRLRLLFAGSPAAAVPSLAALAGGPHAVEAVITRPPTPQGRKRVLTPTPVEVEAERLGLEVLHARSLTPLTDELVARQVDLGVIVAFGGLIREPLLSAPRLGWINLHFSLLPAYRGAAPVQRAIMAGDTRTGMSVFRLTAGLDEGELLAQRAQPIGAHDTAGSLLERLATDGAGLVASVVDALADGTATATPQQGTPSFAPKLTRDDGRVTFTSCVATVSARVRGTTPEPGAFAELDDGTTVKLLEVAIAHDAPALEPGRLTVQAGAALVGTADRPLELIRVQPAGKQAMRAVDWMRGLRDAAERRFR